MASFFRFECGCCSCDAWFAALLLFFFFFLLTFLVFPFFFSKIRKAAESGDSFAEAMMAWNGTKSAESFEWARRAAMHGERDGFYLLGCVCVCRFSLFLL